MAGPLREGYGKLTHYSGLVAEISQAELIRYGFAQTPAARACLARLRDAEDWLPLLSQSADPDLAVASLAQLSEQAPDELSGIKGDAEAMRRLVLLLGSSQALGQHLSRRHDDLTIFQDEPRQRTRKELLQEALAAVTDVQKPLDHLRWFNRRALTRVAVRDLTSDDPQELLPSIAEELADIADAVVNAALEIAHAEVPDHDRARLAILAMGKCGARELNYISDIDVLFVAEPADEHTTPEQAVQIATRVAAAVMRNCSTFTAAGSIWQVDAALRPEGNAGQLVRTLSSMRAYYEKWAKNWEFQALLKARPMAGDLELGHQFCDMVAPMVWSVAGRPHFMAETQSMRQRVISLIPAKEQGREIKLGAGGLRDTEFTVQMLQLVHGKGNESLHLRGTFEALAQLVDDAYVGRAQGEEMGGAYRFQRLLEHRVQLYRMRRTHLMPDDEAGLRRLARGLGFRTREELLDAWRSSARTVQRLHQQVYYSPLLESVAGISGDALRLTPEAARDRMTALGFADPDAAMRHIQSLTSGVGRAAGIQRQLMPAMLGWFAQAPNPDAGLLAFRQLSESLKDSPWYLRALRDEGEMAALLARLLASSRYAVDLLKRNPESVQILASEADRRPLGFDRILGAMTSATNRHDTDQEAAHAIRAVRRRELFRVAAADVSEGLDIEQVGEALADIASATLQAALDLAAREVPGAPEIGIIAMGRWGGRELAYGSDADAMLVIPDTDDPDAARLAGQVITRMRKFLSAPGPDPALEVDIDLRPEGKGGPMVRTLGSYKAYYQRWSDTWEAQALVRAGYGAGPRDLVEEFLAAIDPIRYPDGGVSRAQITDIRKLKARMEVERMPRGADTKRHLKLGEGGLSDVEWTVQVLQMQHGARIPALRTTRTLEALGVLRSEELLTATEEQALREAWVLASRIRNANMLNRARDPDTMPSDARERGNVGYLLRRPPGTSAELVDDYLRAARRASAVVEKLFWAKK